MQYQIFPGLPLRYTYSKLTMYFLGVVQAIAQCAFDFLRLTSSLPSPSQVGMPRRRKESQLHPSLAQQRQRRMRCSCQYSVWRAPRLQGQHGVQMAPACAHSPGRKTEQGKQVCLPIHTHHYEKFLWLRLCKIIQLLVQLSSQWT